MSKQFNVQTDEQKRDFIAEEIRKRVIGPGLTEDAFECKDDASDEIIDNRPTVIYKAGILYPNRNLEDDGLITGNDDETANPFIEADNIADESDADTSSLSDETSANNTSRGSHDNKFNENDRDRADFMPSHIGLVTCLDNNAQNVTIDINYGIYHHLSSEKVCDNVKVKLGRCTLEQLKKTFDYYNSCRTVKTTLAIFGCKSMDDVFVVDEQNLTISPKRIFKIHNSDKGKDEYMQATSFPELLENKAANLYLKLISNPGAKEEMKFITAEEFAKQLNEFEKNPHVKDWMKENNISSPLVDAFEITQDANNTKVRTKRRDLTLNNKKLLSDVLYVDDPVLNHLLPLLLQYNFFKREQINIAPFTIDVSIEKHDPIDVQGAKGVKLFWKVISSKDGLKKYLKVQLQNANNETEAAESSQSNDKSNKKQGRIEANMFQTELKISSDYIIPYTEPHRSSIDDDEYTLNEELYRELPIYGKGVNCGVMWDESGDPNPKWLCTTYAPKQRAASFASKTEYEGTDGNCNVFDMTIWSTKSKSDVLGGLQNIVQDYENWHKSQIKDAGNTAILQGVLKSQEEFKKRLEDNINYLAQNERAYKCFLLANTAMYIQMCLARDPKFKKDRNLSTYNQQDRTYKENAWDYFKSNPQKMEYRPFQLAFLVMNIKSTFENNDPYRNEKVDLIWFPTGGGKTEAYLALTALTIAERRTSGHQDVSGVSVIMRYTLRLLTAQQFERASFLICALEFLRNQLNYNNINYSLGSTPITLGMWIGSASSPNKIADLSQSPYNKFFQNCNAGTMPERNPFPISYCPWCGCKLVSDINPRYHGYHAKKGTLKCINTDNCSFDLLPIDYVDEKLYDNPPTLLFATVDKFALLNDKNKGALFGANTNRRRPDLIIQDELHLISGPLGSLVGMFETMVEEICTERDAQGDVVRRPKVVASTATTRNTLNLIKQLYTREVITFPVSGIRYSNNFFSAVLEPEDSKRLYMGLAPTGHSASELEIRAIASELVAKEKLISEYLLGKGVDLMDKIAVNKAIITSSSTLIKDLDDYWTLVLYYMNLKSLGRTHSRIGQEIQANASEMRKYLYEYPSLDFVLCNFYNRTQEFTSRQDSSRIKSLLIEAESAPRLNVEGLDSISVSYDMDIIQATNMISVGIDIARWNVMFMVGQPLTTAEYIQSSSRVGRTTHGLVVNIYNSVRNRELSYYENYVPYHKEFYKFVEPLTVTTFTPTTLKKLMYNLYLCYMGAIRGYDRPSSVQQNDVNALINIMKNRNRNISNNTMLANLIDSELQNIHNKLQAPQLCNKTFKQLLSLSGMDKLPIMNSLRDIESNTYLAYE